MSNMYGDVDQMDAAQWNVQDDGEGGFDYSPANDAAWHAEELANALIHKGWTTLRYLYLPNGGVVICKPEFEPLYRLTLGLRDAAAGDACR